MPTKAASPELTGRPHETRVKALNEQRVLVTGGAGFVGSSTLRAYSTRALMSPYLMTSLRALKKISHLPTIE